MQKKVKNIREIKSKVKNIRVLSREDESQEDLEDFHFNSEEFSEADNSSNFSRPENLGERRISPIESNVRNVETDSKGDSGTEREFNYTTITTGRNIGADKQEYKPVENIRTDKVREASVGRDFAMQVGGNQLPEDMMRRNVEGRMRDESHEMERENKYSVDNVQHGRKRRSAGPWE